MARDEYLEHLAAVPLFSRCSKSQLQEIGRVADELTVKAGTVLARQGDIGALESNGLRGDLRLFGQDLLRSHPDQHE